MTRPRSICFGFAVCAGLALIAGCGGSPSKMMEQESESSGQTPTEEIQASSSAPETTAPQTTAPNEKRSLVHQKGGRTWIGEVPVDVWFDDPLEVANAGGEVAPAKSVPLADVTKPDAQPMPESTPSPAATMGEIDWKQVIPAELLDAEVTTIRNRFAADLQTVGSYNSSYLGLPPHAAALAVLAHVADQYPDDIRWKKNAKYIKHLAGEMNAQPLRSGPSSQRPLKEKFDSVVEILSGSVPATLEKPPEEESIQDVAKVAHIMKRLANASKLITINGGTADAMKANADQLKQEAAVLGALTQVLLDGYEDYEDDEVFEGYVKNMVEASINMREHVQNDQFDKFELDVSRMNQACQQCHSTYR